MTRRLLVTKLLASGLTLFFGLQVIFYLWIPTFQVSAQSSEASSVGQIIDASAGALTIPCSGDSQITFDPLTIDNPRDTFRQHALNPKQQNTDLDTCDGTGLTVQDTRYEGGFVLQVSATDYVNISDPSQTIPVENLAIVTEQLGTSYNEDNSGANIFASAGDTFISGSDGDNVEVLYTLPFTFNFYGGDHTALYLCSNGAIFLFAGNCSTLPDPLDGIFLNGDRAILPYYKNLTTAQNIDGSFGIFYDTPSPSSVRFRWKGAPVSNTDERVEFQVTITDNGTEDTIRFDYGNASLLTDTGDGPIVGITTGGPAAVPLNTVYTESILSQANAGTDLIDEHAIFISGFNFSEVKKPGTPAVNASYNGDRRNEEDYTAFSPDPGNPGHSLSLELLNGHVDETCSFIPGRIGVYTIYPHYRLTVPNDTPAGTYQNTITYTVLDSTGPAGAC